MTELYAGGGWRAAAAAVVVAAAAGARAGAGAAERCRPPTERLSTGRRRRQRVGGGASGVSPGQTPPPSDLSSAGAGGRPVRARRSFDFQIRHGASAALDDAWSGRGRRRRLLPPDLTDLVRRAGLGRGSAELGPGGSGGPGQPSRPSHSAPPGWSHRMMIEG